MQGDSHGEKQAKGRVAEAPAGTPLGSPGRGSRPASCQRVVVDPPKAGRQSLIELLKRELWGIFPNFSGFKLASFLAVLGLFWP